MRALKILGMKVGLRYTYLKVDMWTEVLYYI